jgi:hypothetical protein
MIRDDTSARIEALTAKKCERSAADIIAASAAWIIGSDCPTGPARDLLSISLAPA